MDDQLSLSSHVPLVHNIPDLDKENGDEVLEDRVEATHEDEEYSIENDASHLVPKEASSKNDVHLLEYIQTTIIIDFGKDEGLVSYVPFKIFEFNDA
jgi:hypothetical protein